MLSHADDHIEIARRAAMRSGVTLAGNANALTIACPCFDAHFEWLCAFDCAFAMAYRAGRNILSRPMATRTGHIELHAPAGLGDLAAASALRTFARRLDVSLTVTVAAGVTAGNVQPHDTTAN